jgi:predicted nucleic acid-binding protein
MPGSVGYLLDTNVLVQLVRFNAIGKAIDAKYGLIAGMSQCVISVETVGELYSLARRFKWGPKKMDKLSQILDELVWIDINHPEVLEAYGEIDQYSIAMGRRMGKNDVWIAATARVSNLTLLTTDNDFDQLAGKYVQLEWFDPDSTKSP